MRGVKFTVLIGLFLAGILACNLPGRQEPEDAPVPQEANPTVEIQQPAPTEAAVPQAAVSPSAMSAAIGVFTLLAMLSKENGILLPLLVGVIELTVVASQRERLPALNRYWSTVFIMVPSAVIWGVVLIVFTLLIAWLGQVISTFWPTLGHEMGSA